MKPTICRGKNDKGEWVYGYYAKIEDYLLHEPFHIIIELGAELYPPAEICGFEIVDPKTVGRLIECPCYDVYSNNSHIFEGDIIEVRPRYLLHADNEMYIAVAVDNLWITDSNGHGRYPQDTVNTKVIGNIWDNPELVTEKCIERCMARFGFKE